MEVRVPWVDGLKTQGGKVPFVGIDGRNLMVQIDYPRDKNMKGRSIIKGAGMPIREDGRMVGRGNLVVQCVYFSFFLFLFFIVPNWREKS
jgi:DnaJ family protein B protein 4